VLHAIQIAAIVLTALAMAPALAHAFEFPAKTRLEKKQLCGRSSYLLPELHIA
jgi:hypothetical protein